MTFPTQITSLILAALLMTTALGDDKEDKYLKAFPAAEEGMQRYVIQLPHKERGVDNNFKVEIFVGKEILTDGVNQARLSGKIESKPLKGWGFTYYKVPSFGPVASTLMAVPPGTKPIKKFVPIQSKTIPYNSRIPLVIYVPEGGLVKYRIWEASEKTETAVPG